MGHTMIAPPLLFSDGVRPAGGGSADSKKVIYTLRRMQTLAGSLRQGGG